MKLTLKLFLRSENGESTDKIVPPLLLILFCVFIERLRSCLLGNQKKKRRKPNWTSLLHGLDSWRKLMEAQAHFPKHKSPVFLGIIDDKSIDNLGNLSSEKKSKITLQNVSVKARS